MRQKLLSLCAAAFLPGLALAIRPENFASDQQPLTPVRPEEFYMERNVTGAAFLEEGCSCHGRDSWELGERLGKGQHGEVVVAWKSSQPSPGDEFAMKSGNRADIDAEVDILRATTEKSCSNVVRLVDAQPCVSKGSTVPPLCRESAYVAERLTATMRDWFKASNKPHCKDTIIAGIRNGIICLHRAGFIHGDIKADNIMYASIDNKGCPVGIKLVDFGLAHRLGSNQAQYAQNYYGGSFHLPGSLFKNSGDSLGIVSRGYYEVVPEIDWCSFAILLEAKYPGTKLSDVQMSRKHCGSMGASRKSNIVLLS